MAGTAAKSPRTRTTSATLRGHLRAGARGDRETGRLERGNVVDAVADHRDVAAGVAQRLNHAPLVLRRDAAEHRVLEHETPQLACVGRQLRGVERGALDARVTGDRGDSLGTVSREHLQLDALVPEPIDGRPRLRSQALGQENEPPCRRPLILEPVCDPEREHAPAVA